MPKVTGIELCRLIRSFDQNTPIFFCSGAVTDADKKAGLSAGAQGFFEKHFDPYELAATLRAALDISYPDLLDPSPYPPGKVSPYIYAYQTTHSLRG